MKNREAWVDNVKIFACILVFVGHFFQSMIEAEIIHESVSCNYFITNIYIFHVPLFFICSGYLYQRGKKVDSFKSWREHAVKKIVSLAVPYVTFSVITWILKVVFSSGVNNEADDIFTTLFIHPTNQYWYFYVIIILFLMIPTLNNTLTAVWVSVIAIVLKIMNVLGLMGDIYVLKRIAGCMIWFVLGMLLQKYCKNRFKSYKLGIVLIALFFVMFSFMYSDKIISKSEEFLLAILACAGFIIFFRGFKLFKANEKIAQYTMPVYLMHIIFAATLRSVLLKIGIDNFAVHAVLGISISVFAPIIAYEIMKKSKFLLFFIEPRTVLSKKK